jgi:hypothetical protein
MRQMLRPGTHVLRRCDGRVQIGLDPAHSVVLNDERFADPLRIAEAPDDELAALAQAGLLVEEGLARRNRPTRAPRLSLVGFGHWSSEALLDRVRAQLSALGFPRLRPYHDKHPDLVLLVGVGEPHRELTDHLVRAGIPHVYLRFVEGSAVVGPWVEPGLTPCLRCIDGHFTDLDPSWPVLVHQYADASSRDRIDGFGEPVDPALAAIGSAWLCRDVATYVAEGQPSTWATTLHLPGDLAGLEVRSWLRHPACGCGGI